MVHGGRGPGGAARVRRSGLGAAGAAALALGAGCASQEELYQVRLENTGEPARHAIHSARLKLIMQRLEALMFERQQTQVAIAEDRRRLTLDAKSVAEGLLESATHIRTAGKDLGLGSADEALYLSLVEKLERQATALAEIADRGDASALSAQYNQIRTTCNACHSNFRKFEWGQP